MVQIRFSSYSQEHIYQTPDSKVPFDSQYTAGETLKSEILIILDIGHSRVFHAKIMKVIFLQKTERQCMRHLQVSIEMGLNKKNMWHFLMDTDHPEITSHLLAK